MARLRSDLWCAAFVRRHNDIGNLCVVARRGDPVAGAVWIEIDHLNGTATLLSPAPVNPDGDSADIMFQRRFDRVKPGEIAARLAREADFDPDFWHLVVEIRQHGDVGVLVVSSE